MRYSKVVAQKTNHKATIGTPNSIVFCTTCQGRIGSTKGCKKCDRFNADHADCDIRARFGKRVTILREQYGMTQKELCIALDMDRSYLSDVENARKGISLEMVEVFALGFRISLSELLRGV